MNDHKRKEKVNRDMPSKELMIDLMAEIIADDDSFKEDRLNDEMIWDQFMDHILNHIQMHPDDTIREKLQSIDVADFQNWIDDPAFWDEINREVEKKVMICKKMFSSDDNVGHC